MNDASFQIFSALLKARSGLVIGRDKIYLLETRLGGIVKRLGLRDLAGLADKLRAGPADSPLEREVVEAMTTNESLFFRDDKPFAHVRQVIQSLHASLPAGAPIRIWSAASSSGQEAYSLAMIVSDLRAALGSRPVEITGTDIAREQLAKARDGLYTQFEVQRGLPMQMLVKHFTKEEGNWRLKEPLRAMVKFREWNLLQDLRPLGTFEIIFCRNVLIYFDAPTKTRVLDALAGQMAPSGRLYLGGAETVLGLTNKLAALPGERGVCQLAGAPAAAATPPSPPPASPAPRARVLGAVS